MRNRESQTYLLYSSDICITVILIEVYVLYILVLKLINYSVATVAAGVGGQSLPWHLDIFVK